MQRVVDINMKLVLSVNDGGNKTLPLNLDPLCPHHHKHNVYGVFTLSNTETDTDTNKKVLY